MTKDQIRAIFMANGFTIKEGQIDLKPYVYEAAEALIEAAGLPSSKGAGEPAAWRHSLTHSLHDTEDEVQLADGDESAQGLYTMDQMRDYALAFHKTRVESLDIADLKRRLERVQVRIAEHRSDPNVTAVTFSTTPEMMLKLVERIEGVESLLAASASASAEPIGEIAHDEVNGFHFAPSVHWLEIGIGTKLYAAPRPIEAPAQVALSAEQERKTFADVTVGGHLWMPADIPAPTALPPDFGERKAYAFKDPKAGEHDPWYVVLPNMNALKLGYHADDFIDQQHAEFIAAAINRAIAAPRPIEAPAQTLSAEQEREAFEAALKRMRFPVLPTWVDGKPHRDYTLGKMWEIWQYAKDTAIASQSAKEPK